MIRYIFLLVLSLISLGCEAQSPVIVGQAQTAPVVFGSIHSDAFTTDLSAYTQNGSTFSVSGGTLNMSTTAGVLTNYIYLNTPSVAPLLAVQSLEKWKQSISFVAPAAGGTNFGFALGVRGSAQYQTLSSFVRLSFSGDALPKGSVYLYTNGGSLFGTQSSTFQPTTGVTYIFEVERLKNQYIARVKSSDESTTHATYTFTYSLTFSTSTYGNSVGNFAVYAIGGTIALDNYTISTDAIKYADAAFFGDSNTYGLYAGSTSARYTELTAGSRQIEIVAAVGAAVQDVKINTIDALRPRRIFINQGSNNLANGESLATLQANYDALLTAISGLGYSNDKVYLIIPVARSGINIAGIKTYLDGKAASGYHVIDGYTATKSAGTTLNASYDSGDGVHINAAGNSALAAIITY